MSDELQRFVSELHSDTLNRATGGDGSGADFKENVFTEVVLETLADPVGAVENPVVSYFEGPVGRGRSKINGFAVSDDETSLDLFVSIYLNASEPTRVPSDEIRKAIEQATRYLVAARAGLHSSLEPAHDAYQMTARIHEVAGRLRLARIFVLTDGVTGMSRAKLPARQVDNIELRFELWDAERMSRAVAYGRPQKEIDIDVAGLGGEPLACVALTEISPSYSAYLAIIPGTLLYRLYDEHRSSLLERNVRSFLQAKGKVNRGIRDTIKNQPEMFMAYNNGISITADEVETARLVDGRLAITRIRGLQIVNGGQTTASIHKAGEERLDLSKVFVQAKITVVKPEVLDELAPRIAEFANTQNPIQMADFSANDPFHIEIERLSKQIWIPGEQGKWFYERARGQYQVALATEGTTDAKARQFRERTPPARRFGKTDLAKYINSWDQLPHLVSFGSQKNFVFFMQRMRETRPKSWKPDDVYYKELIAKAVLYNEVARIVRREEILGHRPQIVAYTIAALSFRSGGHLDLMQLWTQQRISAALEAMLAAWSREVQAEILHTAAGRNVGEWCKKAECWKAVSRLELALPPELPPELQRVVRKSSWGSEPAEMHVAVDPDELDALNRCRRTDTTEWIQIIEWGTATGRLDAEQRRIASELAANAASGWAREVSSRRAREGRAILNLALDSGVFETSEG